LAIILLTAFKKIIQPALGHGALIQNSEQWGRQHFAKRHIKQPKLNAIMDSQGFISIKDFILNE
jgi:hypothetical protein